MEVKSVDRAEYAEWILKKHYAKRMPSISYAYGLFDPDLVGVCTFGSPPSPPLCIGVCGEEYRDLVLELNRLVAETDKLSWFVARCLKMLPESIVVSYADTSMGHHGYIYQATNWIYTGKSQERTDIGSEDGSHSRHYDKSLNYSENRVFRSSKHRYVYFTGSRGFKKKMRKKLKYPVLPYPKGDNKRYDASYEPDIQLRLF